MSPEHAHAADSEESPFFGEGAEVAMAVETAQSRPRVDRVDPVAMAEVLRASSVLSRFHMEGIADPKNVAHPFAGYCKACAMKEPPEETKLDVLWRQIDPMHAPGWFAVNCCDACYEAAKVDTHRLEANREFWEKVCPIEFRKDWDNRRGDRGFLDRVLAFDPKLKRGLIIHGQSDATKTRAVWQLLRVLAENGITWLFIESIDLLDTIPNEAFNVQLLVIDDLGNDHLTGQKEVRLLKLIRTRCNWHRPIIITTQFSSSDLTNKFSQTATAKAVFRRLGEFCDTIEAKTPISSVSTYHNKKYP